MFNSGNSRIHLLFQSTKFLNFTKVVTAIYALMGIVHLIHNEWQLQPFIMYTEYVWRIFLYQTDCYFRGALAAIYFEWLGHYFTRSVALIYFFQPHCVFFQISICSQPYLLRKSSCSHIYFQIYLQVSILTKQL